jgi:outer membrane lipoprotein SlyB
MRGIRPSFSIAGLLAALALSGCATDQGQLAIAATRPIPLDVAELDVATLPVVRDVQGRHTAVTSVLFFPTFAGPHLDAAVAEAIARGHGDVLTRARVHSTRWWLLIGVETLTVRGNVVDLPETR